MSKYVIWDKTTSVIVPTGKVYTPQEWIVKYPAAGVDGIKFVISGGAINGALMMEYTSMVERYTNEGCDFSNCATDREVLDAIEAFEVAQAEASAAKAAEPTAEERIAAAMEYQNAIAE